LLSLLADHAYLPIHFPSLPHQINQLRGIPNRLHLPNKARQRKPRANGQRAGLPIANCHWLISRLHLPSKAKSQWPIAKLLASSIQKPKAKSQWLIANG
jgi:hypothetical protein